MIYRKVYQKIKQYSKIAVVSGILCASTLINTGCSKEENKTKNPEKIYVKWPEKFTQQEISYDISKDFTFYRELFSQYSSDGKINSEELENLEYVLSKSLKEIYENLAKTIKQKDNTETINFEKIKTYLISCYQLETIDLEEIRKQLKYKKEWLEIRENFWNHGTGFFIYVKSIGNKTKLEEMFSENKKELYQEKTEVNKLSDEFPITNKINYLLGLLIGFASPPLTICAWGTLRDKRIRRRQLLEESNAEMMWMGINFLGNPILGYLMLDSIHPLLYPIRIAIPILPMIYEGSRLIYDKTKRKIRDIQFRRNLNRIERNRTPPSNPPQNLNQNIINLTQQNNIQQSQASTLSHQPQRSSIDPFVNLTPQPSRIALGINTSQTQNQNNPIIPISPTPNQPEISLTHLPSQTITESPRERLSLNAQIESNSQNISQDISQNQIQQQNKEPKEQSKNLEPKKLELDELIEKYRNKDKSKMSECQIMAFKDIYARFSNLEIE